MQSVKATGMRFEPPPGGRAGFIERFIRELPNDPDARSKMAARLAGRLRELKAEGGHGDPTAA